jgi:glycerophosphoryl diester phosphodiesterase
MRLSLAAAAACALAAAMAAPAAAVEVHAHRGGTLANGTPVTPENSMTAFVNAVENVGADVVELDAKLTADDVPVIMHDATLDRTTDCGGLVRAKTLAQLGACHIDTIGTGPTPTDVDGTEPIPTLAEVLAWAGANSVRLHLEIKNIPTDGDFDRTDAFARKVLDAIVASGISTDLLLIQSFWPPNLDVAESYGLDTALLTFGDFGGVPLPFNEGGHVFAALRGYEWHAPQWPPRTGAANVAAAHALGLRVVPWTINDAAQVAAARDAGVDALISDDPVMALDVLGP